MSKLNFITLLLLILSVYSRLYAQGSAILSYDKEVFIDGKKKVTTFDYIIQVGQKSDHELGDLSIYYEGEEEVKILKAAIYDKNGNELRKLKKKDFHTRSAVSQVTFYEDSYEMYSSIKTNVYPHIIHFSYSKTTSEFLYLAHWFPSIYSGIPTISSSLTLKFPSNFPVRVKSHEVYSFKEKEEEGMKIMEWKMTSNEKFTYEKNGPHRRNLLKEVFVLPETLNYGEKLLVRDWKDYGNWVNLLNQGLDDLTEDEKIKIHQLTDQIENPSEKVQILYNYLQDHTRYINVSLGIGGLKPYPASYVCENKYGDCKALTNYMHAILKEIGIPSFFVDVYAGDTPKEIDQAFPSQQFNHVILGVVVESDTLYLENTSQNSPFNYLGTFTQNRKGLWIEEDKSRLIDLPTLTSENTLDSIAYTFSLPNNGIQKVKISIETKGGELFEVLNTYSKRSEEKLEKIINQYALSFGVKEFDQIKVINEDRNQASIRIEIEAEYKEIVRKISNYNVITPPKIINTKITKIEERKNPYWINAVIHKKESFSYPIENIKKENIKLPDDFLLESEFGNYSDQYRIEGNNILLERTFYLKPNKISLEDYPNFYEFMNALEKHSKKTSIIIKQQV